MPEDGGAGVAEIGVDELSRDNPMAVEGLAVGEMGIRLAGIRRSIVPGGISVLENVSIHFWERRAYQPPSVSFSFASSSSLPGSGGSQTVMKQGFRRYQVGYTGVERRDLACIWLF